MINEQNNPESGVIIDLGDQNEFEDEDPTNEFEDEEDDNEFLEESPETEIAHKERKQEDSIETQVSSGQAEAQNNDSVISPDNEKLLFDKLGGSGR